MGEDLDDVQDLRYTHDPIGNIVEIDDLAQQTVFFANAEVSPRQRFEYDATYQLTVAEGREHTSQGQPISSELTPGTLPDTNDPAALRAWVETYLHDEVGNLTQVQHTATGGDWTREYQYAAAGNRLLATSAPGDAIGGPFTHQYVYDAHGNMSAMPHLAAVDWDHVDRMQHADLGGGGDVWFVYDSAGNRVRKVRVNQSGSQTEERIYLGGVELYRERQNGTLERERETLHIADDSGRICLVETLTVDAGAPIVAPANQARYQYSNHLGSASLELDEAANTISYEEYHPYGTSSYRAVDSTIEVNPKRYRYTGKERDEETGLDHMGARYYAPWLGRWTSADPIGLGDGVNRYAYVSNNPIGLNDPSGRAGVAYDAMTAPIVDEDPGTNQAATANADIADLTQEFMNAQTEAERQVIHETINLLRDEAGFTAYLEPAPLPDWVLEARRNKAHADEVMSKVGEQRDALSLSVIKGTAVIMAAGATAGVVGVAGAAVVAGTALEGTIVGGALVGAGAGLAGGAAEGGGLQALNQLETTGEIQSWAQVGDATATGGLIGAGIGAALGGLSQAIPGPHAKAQSRILRQPASRSQSGTIKVGNNAEDGINNPIPGTAARVIPGDIRPLTLGRPGTSDVFITAADDIASITDPAVLSTRLAIPASNTFTIIEFSTPSTGLASPVSRSNLGFIGGGRTAGGAREFVIPNQPTPPGADRRVIRQGI